MPATRQFLASHLRGEVKNPRGVRRTYSKISEDARVASHIMFLRRVMGTWRGQRFVMASEEKAKNAFLDENPDMNPGNPKNHSPTIKGQAKRGEQIPIMLT